MEDAMAGHCEVWGVLNVTPDSFSDGGEFLREDDAVARALEMLRQGADVIDVGGASSRPPGLTYGEGAPPVPVGEELSRVLPVVERLASSGVRVSVDTTRAEVARAALERGALIINDVSGESEGELLDAVAAHDACLVLMHSRAGGRVDAETTAYVDVVADVRRELGRQIERALAAGVDRARLWVDPGLGFAKTAEQSLRLLARLDALVAMGHPVLLGASRKSFLAVHASEGAERPAPSRRLGASLAAALAGARAGVAGLRVHDVFETRQALLLASSLAEAGAP